MVTVTDKSSIPSLGIVHLSGRVQSVRHTASQQLDRNTETLIVLPAPDAYSSPSTIAVLSGSPFGNSGQDVNIICRVTGFPRRWDTKDPQGFPQTVHSANNQLLFVSMQ